MYNNPHQTFKEVGNINHHPYTISQQLLYYLYLFSISATARDNHVGGNHEDKYQLKQLAAVVGEMNPSFDIYTGLSIGGV